MSVKPGKTTSVQACNLLRGTSRAGVLADGLLGENGGELGAFDCGNVTRSGQPQPIAENHAAYKPLVAKHVQWQAVLREAYIKIG